MPRRPKFFNRLLLLGEHRRPDEKAEEGPQAAKMARFGGHSVHNSVHRGFLGRRNSLCCKYARQELNLQPLAPEVKGVIGMLHWRCVAFA